MRFPAVDFEGGVSLERRARALALRVLDPALAACALFLGLGASQAWIAVAVAGIAAVMGGTIRPNVLAKPYLLFALALGLNSLLAWPQLGGLFVSHAWAMVRPAVAIVLAGAIASGVRAWGFGLLFTSGAALRSLLGLAGVGPPLEPILFLQAAALILLAAAWAVGSLPGTWRALTAALAIPLAAAIWSQGGHGAWISLAVGLAAMAALTRRIRGIGWGLGLTLGVGAASYWLKRVPFSSIDLGAAWSQALAILARNPAGIGAGNFASQSQGGGAYGPGVWDHPHNSLLSTWAENGPVGLIAAVWILGALLAALRRGWKVLDGGGEGRQEQAMARTLVAGTAGVVGLFVAWSFTDDPLAEKVVGYALGFLVALGVGAAAEAALPSQEESLLAVGKGVDRVSPLPRKAAAGAAVAIAGAALGGLTALGATSPTIRLVCAGLLLLLALLHLPKLLGREDRGPATRSGSAAEDAPLDALLGWLGSPLGRSLRGLVVFLGAALLVVRPFAAPLAPGTAQWWQSSSAAVALFALGAAIAGAGHAIRRPGRIRPAPVAGALTFLGVFAFVGLLDLGALATVAPGFQPEAPYNFAVAACAVSLIFLAWSGPLAFGEAEVDPRVRRFVELPAVAVGVGLLATAFFGLP